MSNIQGDCPSCGSDNVEYIGQVEDYLHQDQIYTEQGVFYTAHCHDCGADFKEIYSTNYLGSVMIERPKYVLTAAQVADQSRAAACKKPEPAKNIGMHEWVWTIGDDDEILRARVSCYSVNDGRYLLSRPNDIFSPYSRTPEEIFSTQKDALQAALYEHNKLIYDILSKLEKNEYSYEETPKMLEQVKRHKIAAALLENTKEL